VDLSPLVEPSRALLTDEDVLDWPYGNDADEVDISGSLVIDVVTSELSISRSACMVRVESWLEEEQEE
jgi:hypothetical protein